jgi:hypothetical protein
MDAAGLALFFEGQVPGGMAWAGLAVAAGASALSAEGDQGGGQERALEFKGFDARLKVAADQSGVLGDFHAADDSRSRGWHD